MTKGQHGNKEAKKPKKVPAAPPLAPGATSPGALAVAALRQKKR